MRANDRSNLSIQSLIALALIVCLGFAIPGRLLAQTFNDVPTDYWAFSFIETLAASGITGGCGGNNYCPEDDVTRAQMAVFLERGMNGSSFSPPAATGNVFLDVGANDFAAAFIEQLFLDGITAGCGGNNYCPDDQVTRAQMAVFLLRAEHGAGYSPPPATGVFNDVDLSHWAVAWIEQLAVEGITSGCGGGNYCPNNPVTRAQMAVFLVRTFDLPPAPNEVHYYVSLGTSLSVGIQPNASGANQLTNDGYADQLFDIIKPLFDIIEPQNRELQLLKLGCPGETTTTMIDGGICTYPEGSQLAAAVAFLNAQKDKVELITIDMGANDLLEGGCIVGTEVDFVCIQGVSMQISTNLAVILPALREAADPGTPIVGMNYYNPFLAFWLIGIEGQVLAMESASAVSLLNDDMGLTYAASGIPVADVASAFQSDDFVTIVPFPLPPPNDFIPLNVATICLLTYMCEPDPVGPNIHANPTGYGVIAATFAAILP